MTPIEEIPVTACLVTTNGDEAGLIEVIDTIPEQWRIVVWDNGWPTTVIPKYGAHLWNRPRQGSPLEGWNNLFGSKIRGEDDLSFFARYELINMTDTPLIYTQNDNVIVDNPMEILDAWLELEGLNQVEQSPHPQGHLVANCGKIGLGAIFQASTPQRIFDFYEEMGYPISLSRFHRSCDVYLETVLAIEPEPLIFKHSLKSPSCSVEGPNDADVRAMTDVAMRCREKLIEIETEGNW